MAAAKANESKGKAQLEHSQGGVSTRDDALDLGVPMLAGDPNEPVGPEDALGAGKKRGDYSSALPAGYNPHTSEVIPEGERVEGGPTVRLLAQRERASEQGEEKGLKGGVQTA